MRLWHLQVVEVEVDQCRVVKMCPVDHPQHPITQIGKCPVLLRLWWKVLDVVDSLERGREVGVDGLDDGDTLNRLLDREGQLCAHLPGLVLGGDAIGGLAADFQWCAAKGACGDIEREALRKLGLDLEAAFELALARLDREVWAQRHSLADGIRGRAWFCCFRIRQHCRRSGSHLHGQLHGGLAGLVRGRYRVGRLFQRPR
mmetsp:Transcript_59374/g.170596  ORF Transcript_59374/g.170596 Transcript_59374/m.170596 type:complete len:201 (-) Transcript_59374:1659-2261(-)